MKPAGSVERILTKMESPKAWTGSLGLDRGGWSSTIISRYSRTIRVTIYNAEFYFCGRNALDRE